MSSVKIIENTLLSDNWYVLRKITFDYLTKDGKWQRQSRECYDRGNGAVIMLYNKEDKTVVLTKQFRMPTYMNGNTDGMMIEACAGLLDNQSPEDCIKRETEEETGFRISNVQKLWETYMSPGSVTEILHFFIAEYSEQMKVSEGGGHEDEHENIDVLKMSFSEAFQLIKSGEIKDAKTIMLLQHIALYLPEMF